MTKTELHQLRDLFLGLTQDQISLMFGFGTKTFHKYLTGEYQPTTAHTRFMRLVLYVPEAATWLAYNGCLRTPKPCEPAQINSAPRQAALRKALSDLVSGIKTEYFNPELLKAKIDQAEKVLKMIP